MYIVIMTDCLCLQADPEAAQSPELSPSSPEDNLQRDCRRDPQEEISRSNDEDDEEVVVKKKRKANALPSIFQEAASARCGLLLFILISVIFNRKCRSCPFSLQFQHKSKEIATILTACGKETRLVYLRRSRGHQILPSRPSCAARRARRCARSSSRAYGRLTRVDLSCFRYL